LTVAALREPTADSKGRGQCGAVQAGEGTGSGQSDRGLCELLGEAHVAALGGAGGTCCEYMPQWDSQDGVGYQP
jgi:hypothetical protein